MKTSLPKITAKFFALIACAISLTFLHCAATRTLPTLSKQPDCEASLEGFYSYGGLWRGKKPALILRQDYEYKIISGTVISQTETGVTFDPDREGAFYDPKPEFYAFDRVEAFIDQNGKIVAGAIPPKFSKALSLELHLRAKNAPEAKPFKMLLKPNQQFGFCTPAGSYEISAIRFIDKEGNIDLGVDYPKIEIHVEKNLSNYIGHWWLGDPQTAVSDSMVIPYKIGARPHGAAMAGFLGGAIGGAIYGAALASKGVVGEYKLYFTAGKNFRPLGKNEIKYQHIKSLP
jgi:hypothetical protein